MIVFGIELVFYLPRGVIIYLTCILNIGVVYMCPAGLELPFMMMSHPLIPVSLPPASVTMAMNQMNHLSTIASMAANAQAQSDANRVAMSVIKVRISSS